MEPEGTLPFPQVLTSGPYSKPYEFRPHPTTLYYLYDPL